MLQIYVFFPFLLRDKKLFITNQQKRISPVNLKNQSAMHQRSLLLFLRSSCFGLPRPQMIG